MSAVDRWLCVVLPHSSEECCDVPMTSDHQRRMILCCCHCSPACHPQCLNADHWPLCCCHCKANSTLVNHLLHTIHAHIALCQTRLLQLSTTTNNQAIFYQSTAECDVPQSADRLLVSLSPATEPTRGNSDQQIPGYPFQYSLPG